MKCKVKKGQQLLFMAGCRFYGLIDTLIINFNNRYTFESFTQKRNHLLIKTTEGEIDIVFTGETPKLQFDNFCKDQLVLKIIKPEER